MQGAHMRTQANGAWMEHKMLDHVKDALRVTLDWKVPSVGLSRKLSSVQFALKAFQRHLERMMDLEERDGYMVFVAEAKPNMLLRVEHLEREHDLFRCEIRNLLPEVEALSEHQNDEFEDVCSNIRQLLERIDKHDVDEIDLMQETLLCDEGGEG
ncbi:MAG: hypothetical protein MK171_11470 [Pirellulales bacterium]|nr:hypothetical protein [Pirellulales bacterium]